MILSTIATVNERITAQLATDKIQVTGVVVPVYSQSERTTSLILPSIDAAGQAEQFVINSDLLWQSAHLTDGTRVVNSQTFGSFTDHQYHARFVLIGLSKSPHGLNVAKLALIGTAYVVIDDDTDKTAEVLSRYFQIKIDQGKNYDPSLFAFAVRYHIVGLNDDDMAELPTPEQVAQLPIKVPEPEVIVVPGPPEPGSGNGGHYVHNQLVPAAEWMVHHNLGYNPGGIVIYDSAGSLWLPDTITYVDANRLIIAFGPASFGGKAYLS